MPAVTTGPSGLRRAIDACSLLLRDGAIRALDESQISRSPRNPAGAAASALGHWPKLRGVVRNTPPDLKETFSIGPPASRAESVDDPAAAFVFSETPWPAGLPDMESVMRSYYDALAELVGRLLVLVLGEDLAALEGSQHGVEFRREAADLVLDYWGGMLDRGADTFWEVWDPNDERLSPYGSHLVNSYCHAWSCTPAWFIRTRPEAFRSWGEDTGDTAPGP